MSQKHSRQRRAAAGKSLSRLPWGCGLGLIFTEARSGTQGSPHYSLGHLEDALPSRPRRDKVQGQVWEARLLLGPSPWLTSARSPMGLAPDTGSSPLSGHRREAGSSGDT